MNTAYESLNRKQRDRLAEMMFEDILAKNVLQAPAVPSLLGSPGRNLTGAKLMDAIEKVRTQRTQRMNRATDEMIASMLSREELFRFAYVPFAVAELVWDYADTVIVCAQKAGNPATRKLSRTIRQCRREYDRLRHRFIDSEHREREVDNGYVFEDTVKHITSQMLVNVKGDIRREYPHLEASARDLLIATYQCMVLASALVRYNEKQRQRVAERIRQSVGDILPPCFHSMRSLLPQYLGDKPASPQLQKLLSDYVASFAGQMQLISLDVSHLTEIEIKHQ